MARPAQEQAAKRTVGHRINPLQGDAQCRSGGRWTDHAVSVCGGAYTGERPRMQDTPCGREPSPMAVPTSQLCRIDIKGDKKDRVSSR